MIDFIFSSFWCSRPGRIAGALVLNTIFAACGSYQGTNENNQPVWEGYAIAGLATPFGPIYFGGANEDERIVEHEWCHIERWRKIGGALGWLPYYRAYLLSSDWACNEERECGIRGPHPQCR